MIMDVKFSLTDQERSVLDLLREVCRKKRLSDGGVVLRVAGGWVRNKLLGIEPAGDMDLAIEGMPGVNFALLVKRYCEERGFMKPKKKSNEPSEANSSNNNQQSNQKNNEEEDTPREFGFGIIKANPEQSKHLETAVLTLFGTQIDCVALRTEVYSSKSRIPEIVRGFFFFFFFFFFSP